MNRIEFLASCNINPNEEINGFFKEYRWLSNFHLCKIPYHRLVFPSSENAFQAEKTVLISKRVPFTKCAPHEAKKLGRQVLLRKNWENIKIQKMEEILKIKFNIPELKEKLKNTENAILIEGNWWHDNYWGDCVCDKCINIIGQNNLRKLIMKIRGKL